MSTSRKHVIYVYLPLKLVLDNDGNTLLVNANSGQVVSVNRTVSIAAGTFENAGCALERNLNVVYKLKVYIYHVPNMLSKYPSVCQSSLCFLIQMISDLGHLLTYRLTS